MATTFIGWRPSTPAAACPPNVLANAAQVLVLGQRAVQVQVPVVRDLYAFAGKDRAGSGSKVRTAPVFDHPAVGDATKINNYMGTIAAAATVEGATTSSLIQMNSAFVRVQMVQGDKVKGGDARGNPPRGRPV